MKLLIKNTPEYFIEIYLILPVFIRRNSESILGGVQKDIKINLNLFTFNLTRSKQYFMMEFGILFGVGIKIIEKESV